MRLQAIVELEAEGDDVRVMVFERTAAKTLLMSFYIDSGEAKSGRRAIIAYSRFGAKFRTAIRKAGRLSGARRKEN